MRTGKSIVAVIPARGGSKGITKKNIKLLCNYPLIYYSINASKSSKFIKRTIVTTDNKEIADISKEFSAEVIKRPAELAKDDSPTIDSVIHIINVLENNNYPIDAVVLLQPTSPLRTFRDIDDAIELFLNNDCESVVSVAEVSHSPYWSFKIDGSYIEPLFGYKYFKMRRQELPDVYIPNGAIFISTPDILIKDNSFYSKKTMPYIMSKENSIDIDDYNDFMLAELYMSRSLERGKSNEKY